VGSTNDPSRSSARRTGQATHRLTQESHKRRARHEPCIGFREPRLGALFQRFPQSCRQCRGMPRCEMARAGDHAHNITRNDSDDVLAIANDIDRVDGNVRVATHGSLLCASAPEIENPRVKRKTRGPWSVGGPHPAPDHRTPYCLLRACDQRPAVEACHPKSPLSTSSLPSYAPPSGRKIRRYPC
jgi:hypothetical protein